MNAPHLTRRHFLGSAALATGLLHGGYRASASDQKPLNIVFILADDMGWTGPACFGSDLHETPNIDRLAREGLRFTNAYTASPVCTPTRASIMTGKHPARLNMTIWSESAIERRTNRGDKPLVPPLTEAELALEYETIAEALQEKGYRTLHVGKWHLGGVGRYPETHGFEANIGATHWGAPRSYWYPYHGLRQLSDGQLEHRYVPGLPFGKEGEYLTDRLTTEALAALEHVKDEPFFLHMAYHNPHTPIEGKPELVAHYKKKIREGMNHTNAQYAAMVHNLDENIGRILDRLEAWGIADHTLVIFYSDNGGFTEVRDAEQVTTNVPLRSGKGSLYEGGIRVPLIIKTPDMPNPGGKCHTPATSTDLYPTLLDLAGSSGLKAKAEPLDGVSLAPLLRDSDATIHRESLFFHYPHYYFNTTPASAIRHGDWKLLEYYEDNHLELYNLADDIGETTDLSKTHPEQRDKLHRLLSEWRTEVNAHLPEPNV